MKKITLSEATDEQIENAILFNPEQFSFSDLPIDREDLIEAAMNDVSWNTGYSEYVDMVDEPVSFRDYVESYIDENEVTELRVLVDRNFEEMNGDIHIECQWVGLSKKYGNWFSSDMEIEVE